MEQPPEPLADARFLLARVGTAAPPHPAEIRALRDRLAAMRAHPSCGPERAGQLSGALLVLDVLARADAPPGCEALAG